MIKTMIQVFLKQEVALLGVYRQSVLLLPLEALG
jgi:hypothetical protein